MLIWDFFVKKGTVHWTWNILHLQHILLHCDINALQVQEMRKDNQQRSENLAEDIANLLKTNISLKDDVPVEVNDMKLIFFFDDYYIIITWFLQEICLISES